MTQDDPSPRAPRTAIEDARPPAPGGVERRLGHALLQHRLFGAPTPTLGRFSVQRKLGEGGMGAVFEGTDPVLGRRVALKVLRDVGRRSAPVDIAHEARMLARLSHPHVVTVYELGLEDGEPYVCMELIDGPHLGTWLADNPEATWRTVVTQLLGAGRGLAAAHGAGVVHRDFKLENVLVGANGVPRVTDFGLARSSGASDATVAGTPGYVAPEVLAGGPATDRSDQYAFFMALRFALGRVPGPVPRGLDALIARGTATAPEDRFPDMRAAADALQATLERRGNADQRARDVLTERVQQLWVAPVRHQGLRGGMPELPLRSEPLADLTAGRVPLALGDGAPARIATALHTLRAFVVLIGAPGAGKTLRLLAIAEALVRQEREADAGTLPVVLNLSSYPSWQGDGFEGWLLHELVGKYALPRRQAEQWLEDGQLALLLDGLDEVAAPDRARCVAALDDLRLERPVATVVTCREENFRALAPRPRADAVLRLLPLETQVLARTLRDAGGSEGVAAAVAADEALAEQLRNPLLLALFRELADDLSGPPGPDALRGRLYALALRRALDAAPPLGPPDRSRMEEGLRWLAGASQRAGATDLWLEDLQVTWLPRRGQRIAATALGVGAAFALSLAVNLAAAHLAGQPASSGVFFGLIAAAAAFVIEGSVRIRPMEAMTWSWARVRTWIPRNLALGVVTGGLHGLFFDFWADLMLGTATGLLGLSVIGLVPQGRERRVNPGDGLLESLRNSLWVAPLVGFIIGAPVGYVVLPLARPLADPASMYHTHPSPELAWALTMGTSATVTSLYITGFLAPLLHAALRLVIAWTTPLPLRLTPWLDDLVARGLLHRVGGGWMFRHPTFRAWLAEEDGRPVSRA